jgi:hypothetical protein
MKGSREIRVIYREGKFAADNALDGGTMNRVSLTLATTLEKCTLAVCDGLDHQSLIQ